MDCLGCSFEDTPTMQNLCQANVGISIYIFLSLIESLIKTQCSIMDPCRRARSPSSSNAREYDDLRYDFIIVGGGVAGTVLASRLSENPQNKVLLLEAGPEEPVGPSIPMFAFTAANSSVDWRFETIRQKKACQANGGICSWPRGKMICGTACLSGMMYTRGSPSIYNHWEVLGNKGWNYQEALHYFKKSENNTQASNKIDPAYHGFEGPMKVSNFPHKPRLADKILTAAEEIGYSVHDLNGKNQTGFFTASVMVDNGVRASPSRMYLRPAMNRKNLRVLIQSHVLSIQFNQDKTKATGVRFHDKWGNVHEVYASKEVILSAGVVGSPQILLLSGVGPKEELKKHQIPLVKDLPVGENLNHHFGIGCTATFENINEDDFTVNSIYEYMNSRTGPMSSTGLTQITGFLETTHTKKGTPDIQIYMDNYDTKCTMNNESRNITLIGLRPAYLISKCRGKITLRSTDPYDKPYIDPNYLCDETEEDSLLQAIRILQKLMKTKTLKRHFLKFGVLVDNQCRSLRQDSDEYWRCQIRQYTLGENHHAGTCKMGPVDDPTSVVDHRLRVHGISNLRVIDASIMPTPINCNTIAPVIMIGEKGADMVKEDWKSFPY